VDVPRSPAELARRVRRHENALRFCLRFSIYSVLAFAALFALQDRVVEPFTSAIAWIAYKLLRAIGMQAWRDGVTIGVGGFAVHVRTNCNAIYEMGLYAAACLAYRAPMSRRATGIAVGVVVLYVVNLVRVASLVCFGYLLPEFFEAAHVYVWQALYLVVVAALWLGWVGRVRPVA
jgi:exosortase H (IPTLxxWG-CTERM-specific)